MGTSPSPPALCVPILVEGSYLVSVVVLQDERQTDQTPPRRCSMRDSYLLPHLSMNAIYYSEQISRCLQRCLQHADVPLLLYMVEMFGLISMMELSDSCGSATGMCQV